MTERTIDINDIGPIRSLRIPLSGDGGVIVLNGRNGLGKSTAIDAVESAIKGSGALSVRRGSSRGTVDACGVTIRVGRNTRRSGELEVETLEGKLSVADLVNPNRKEEDAADRVRMRALLHVVQYDGSSAGPRFRALLPPGEFDKLVQTDSLATTDPVEMAASIKRDLEAAALRLEREAEGLSGRAKGLEDAAHGIPAPEGSETELAKRLSELTLELERMEQHNRDVDKARQEQESAAATLNAWLESSVGKLSTEQAGANLEQASLKLTSCDQRIAELEAALAEAKSTREQCAANVRTETANLSEARTREQAIAAHREKAAKEVPMAWAAELLDKMRGEKAEAEKRISDGGVRRKAQEDRKYAGELRGEASAKNANAMRLRDAGKATDDVLTDLVAGCGVALTVNQGRLVYNDGSQERLFHELSEGEKYRIALDIAIKAANRLVEQEFQTTGIEPPGVLLTIPQEAWESLDPYNRRNIAAQARDGGVWIVTAIATADNSLCVTRFDGSEPIAAIATPPAFETAAPVEQSGKPQETVAELMEIDGNDLLRDA